MGEAEERRERREGGVCGEEGGGEELVSQEICGGL